MGIESRLSKLEAETKPGRTVAILCGPNTSPEQKAKLMTERGVVSGDVVLIITHGAEGCVDEA